MTPFIVHHLLMDSVATTVGAGAKFAFLLRNREFTLGE